LPSRRGFVQRVFWDRAVQIGEGRGAGLGAGARRGGSDASLQSPRICFRIDPDDRLFRPGHHGAIGFRKPCRRGEGRTASTTFTCQPSSLAKTHQRPGVVSCSKDHQRRGWEHSLAKHRESGSGRTFPARLVPSRVPSGPCQTTASSVGTVSEGSREGPRPKLDVVGVLR